MKDYRSEFPLLTSEGFRKSTGMEHDWIYIDNAMFLFFKALSLHHVKVFCLIRKKVRMTPLSLHTP